MHGRPQPETPTRAAPAGPGAAADAPGWQVRLLGALEADCGGQRLTRFPSRAAAALLARLALHPDRAHAREELIELLWPGAPADAGRNRLRQTLSSLKSQLLAAGGCDPISADRISVRARPGTLASDASRFDQLVRSGDVAAARALYGGAFMPGHYDDWVLDERRRLDALFERLDQVALAATLQAAPLPAAMPAAPAASAPALASAPATAPATAHHAVAPLPSGLPHYWTRSIGAELAASRLSVLVRTQRLVTVHGPGGSGKTRLAVDVARALLDDPAPHLQDMDDSTRFDRVSFVPMVDCVDAAQMLDALCAALHLEVAPGQAPARIAAALSGGRTLLVLDNLEQLDPQACQAIARLLAASSSVHVLATSRQLLDLDGEQAFELDGLALPGVQASPQESAANPAVMLFADRARAARADFRLEPAQLRPVVDLVRLLGGMPLAIELAASRVRTMAPSDLLRRLTQDAGTPMLDLLARNAQRSSADNRHASMRHVVGWSWRQLNPGQVALMQAMTVLSAPAQGSLVAALAGLQEHQANRLLDSLCDASLVRPVEDAGHPLRYMQQQPVREYAAQTWSAQGARLARQRLRRWLLDCITQAQQQGHRAVADAVAQVLPLLHGALHTAPADGEGAVAWQLALALRSHWDADDLPTSSLLALQQGLADLAAGAAPGTPGQAAVLADAHELLALGFANAGQLPQALVHADAAIDQARQAADDRRLANALTRWVLTRYFGGQFDTATLLQTLDQAGQMARRSGDPAALALVLRAQSPLVSNLLLDYAQAERLSAQGQQLWEQAGNPTMARLCLVGQATMWAWQNQEERALPVYAQCEAAALADGDWTGALLAARQMGRVHGRLRQWPQAVQALRRAVHTGWQRRYGRGLANALLNIGEPLLMAGQPEAAACLHGFAQAHWARLFGVINPIEAAELRRTRRLLRLRLGPDRAQALRLQGAGMDLAAAVDLALAADAP